jgi:hypothetical protein
MRTPSELAALSKIREQQPGLVANIEADLREYLMRTWRDGVADGLEMAARMADDLRRKDALSEEQQVLLVGLADALREAAIKPRRGAE